MAKSSKNTPVRLTPAEVDGMRKAGRLASSILEAVAAMIRPGVTTGAIDDLVDRLTRAAGATSGPFRYVGGGDRPFPKHCCTSVNEVVCHGIPNPKRTLREGDIVNVDVTAYVDGMHGDCSATYPVGELARSTASLVELTGRALQLGIDAVRVGEPLAAIGRAIQPFAFAHGLGVVADYGGHGIGRHFHAAPHIDHVVRPARHVALEGMVFTIEPMLTAGVATHDEWDDGWTVVTADLLPTAQFEHTVIVRDGRAHPLTV